MKHARLTGVALAACMLSVVLLSGCAQVTSADEGTPTGVWGYVAAASRASIEVDNAKSSVVSLVADRVVAPVDSWLVVYAERNGILGEQVGLKRVTRGETRSVIVPLSGNVGRTVVVLLQADKGTPKKFEFDMDNKEQSPDRPLFVDGAELAVPVTLRSYGVPVAAGAASISVWRQGSITDTLTVGEVLTPEDGWVVIHADNGGVPGAILGKTWVPAGRSADITVALSPPQPTGRVFVMLHADLGEPQVFEFDAARPLSSIDQPFYAGGKEVVSEVPIKK